MFDRIGGTWDVVKKKIERERQFFTFLCRPAWLLTLMKDYKHKPNIFTAFIHSFLVTAWSGPWWFKLGDRIFYILQDGTKFIRNPLSDVAENEEVSEPETTHYVCHAHFWYTSKK